jgi:hypothetical protein
MIRWTLCLLLCFGVPLVASAQDGPSETSAATDATPDDSAPSSAGSANDVQPDNSVSADLSAADAGTGDDDASKLELEEFDDPWDYSPYRVLVWLVSDDPKLTVSVIEKPLREWLDRDFAAVWRVTMENAPPAVASSVLRNLHGITYDSMTASDPVLALKRDHSDAVRIRTAKNIGQYVKAVYGTQQRIDEVLARAAAVGDETLSGVQPVLQAVPGDSLSVAGKWAEKETEAILVSRGLAVTLTDPEAKLIAPEISQMVGQIVEQYDKVFILRVQSGSVPVKVEAIEFDVLMRHFGPVVAMQSLAGNTLVPKMGEALTEAFRPVVRIENAGQRNADGLLRAGGLIVDPESPANVLVGDVLEPMTRKNDRNDDPILIGPLGWAFLSVDEIEGRNIKMEFYAGRAGGLQGRKNNRTFRVALKVRPQQDATLLRLHLQRKPDFPLIGYEIYEKELKSSDMTFVGRTDWDGRLKIERTDRPFRLLYVKNGGAVLARLPLVPGLYPVQIADLSGDDMRLQAEAYIRGVQNSIVDLIAIRELFKARIQLRLERGEMAKAEALMEALRQQPSNEKLATEMGKRQTEFIKALGNNNANQRTKVDEMFTTTRELLSKHINPKLIRDLESLLIAARENGGKLPPQPKDGDE